MATTQTIATKVTPVQALNRLTKIGLGLIFSQVFLTALDLGVFEELGNGPATREELARKLNIHPEGCRRLLSVLHHLELVRSDGSQYENSAVGDFLTSKSPYPFRGLSMWGVPFYHMWEFFADALREYSPRWQQALGTTAQETFAALYEDPVRLRRFTELMNAYSILQGQEMARRLDFRPYRRLLDVAGWAWWYRDSDRQRISPPRGHHHGPAPRVPDRRRAFPGCRSGWPLPGRSGRFVGGTVPSRSRHHHLGLHFA